MRTMPKTKTVLAAALALSAPQLAFSLDAPSFAKACAAAAEKAEEAKARWVRGADEGWLFLKSELAHLGAGKFWEKDWGEVSRSGTDPVPVLLALNEKLSALGVKFIFVPVPPKAAIYPDKFAAGADAGSVAATAPFLKRLSDGGVSVIDLEPVLRAARADEASPSYCMTDSHPAPSTCELIASLVAEELGGEDWVAEAAKAAAQNFTVADPIEVEIKGDLIPDDKRAGWPAEKVSVSKVSPVKPDDAASPVILLGDSHTLIFHEGGEMLMTGAGVPDHLQAKLGFKVYLAASRGSSSQAQRQIYKGADFWDGKKALVWVASAREFTQERKWLKLPRLPK